MTKPQENTCHERHIAISKLLDLINESKPSTKFSASQIEEIENNILIIKDNPIRCGHFGIWCFDETFKALGIAAKSNNETLINTFIRIWFILIMDMLNNPKDYCGSAPG